MKHCAMQKAHLVVEVLERRHDLSNPWSLQLVIMKMEVQNSTGGEAALEKQKPRAAGAPLPRPSNDLASDAFT